MLYDPKRRWLPRRIPAVATAKAVDRIAGLLAHWRDARAIDMLRDSERLELGLPLREDEPVGFWR